MMGRKTLLFSIIIMVSAVPFILSAGWSRTYGGSTDEVGYCVEQTRDSGYIICGAALGPRWNLFKTNQTGDTIWTHYASLSYCVQQTADGGYIVTGEALIEDGKYHIYLERVDSSGNSVWYRDELNGVGYCIQQTLDGGYILTGHKSEWIQDGIQDLCLIKFDSLGDTLWAKTYGSDGEDCGLCVRQTSDSGYIVAGYTSTDWSFWVLKFDETGDTMWSVGIPLGKAYSVAETADSGFIATGYVAPYDDGKHHLYLLKMDSSGDTLWSRMDMGWLSQHGGGEARCVKETPDGGFITAGYTAQWHDEIDDLWLVKTDSVGDTLWTRIYGGEEEDMGYCVDQTSDGGYVIAGGTKSFGAIGYDIWLLKTDANGDTLGITEQSPVTHLLNWQVPNRIGQQIVLQYSDMPNGFHASVLDATGRKVDELHSSEQSGMITWGKCYGSGVYFIREVDAIGFPSKVVLIR